MLNIKWLQIAMMFFIGILCFSSSAFYAVAGAEETDKIGILPFSKLVSDTVKAKIGKYYNEGEVEKTLVDALQNKGIVVNQIEYPNGQQPFTYDEIGAPRFDIDSGDFATPEQILNDIASHQKFDKIIFGHLEEVSDALYFVARVYSKNGDTIASAPEQKIQITQFKSKKIGIAKLKAAIDNLIVEITEIIKTPSVPPHNITTLNDRDDFLFGFGETSPLSQQTVFSRTSYATPKDIYKMVLENEFYVHPNYNSYRVELGDLVKELNTTPKKLTTELKYHSRSTTYKKFKWIIEIKSKPTGKTPGRLLKPSNRVFDLCIFEPSLHDPNFGFRWMTYQRAQSIIANIKKIPVMRDPVTKNLIALNDWRIPTIEELFAITRYLPLDTYRCKKGCYFWSSTLTAGTNLWIIRKFFSAFNQKTGRPFYGIDFGVAALPKGNKALLIAVRTCP